MIFLAKINSERYIVLALAKSSVKLGGLELSYAHNRALCGFFVHSTQRHFNGGLGEGAERLAGFVSASPPTLLSSPPVCLAALVVSFINLLTRAVVMTTIPTEIVPEVNVINNKVVTSSLAVADYFGKRHKNVLRAISNLDCSTNFYEHNFAPVKYIDAKGEERPAFNITRDGFCFLAFSFTGKRAAQYKESYINAFNKLESRLHQKLQSDLHQNTFTLDGIYHHMSIITKAWDKQLYPMLKSVDSPLAAQLHDHIHDCKFMIGGLINFKKIGGNQ